jgi:hypothetical protein
VPAESAIHAEAQLEVRGASYQRRRQEDQRWRSEDEHGKADERRVHGADNEAAMSHAGKLGHQLHPMIIRATIDDRTPTSNPTPTPSLMLWATISGGSFRSSARDARRNR